MRAERKYATSTLPMAWISLGPGPFLILKLHEKRKANQKIFKVFPGPIWWGCSVEGEGRSIRDFYPELSRGAIKMTWSYNKMNGFFNEGYLFCSRCNFMIKIDETHCRKCGIKFRHKAKGRKRG